MAVYSSSLFAGSVSATNLTLYTAPSGLVVVVRDITGGDRSGTANSNPTFFLVSGGSIEAVFLSVENLAAYGSYHFDGRVVMPTGWSLGIGSGAWPQAFAISGYELTSP